jgi:hypothetical protein
MSKQTEPMDVMIQMFKDDDSLVAKLKAAPDPLSVIEDVAKQAKIAPAYMEDKALYRIAVVVLGALALIAAVGSISLVSIGKATPEVLVALGSAAVGALVGLFAPSPTK